MKRHSVILWILFLFFAVIRVVFKVDYWLVLLVEACGMAIAILCKTKMPSRKYVVISAVLAILSTVAYLGYQRNPWILLYGLRAGIPTLICGLAVFAVMEKRGEYALLSKKGKHPVVVSILIAIAVGAVLSVINILMSGEKVAFNLSFGKIFLCLNPGIYEEMACRAIFMAFCVWFSDREMNLFEKITMYVMMCVPHAAAHGYPLLPTLILSVLFGLPFAIMQKKRDITSAMLSHGIVDAVRFTLIGF